MTRPNLYTVPKDFEIYRELDQPSMASVFNYQLALLDTYCEILGIKKLSDSHLEPNYYPPSKRKRVHIIRSSAAEQYEYAQAIKADGGAALARDLLAGIQPDVDEISLPDVDAMPLVLRSKEKDGKEKSVLALDYPTSTELGESFSRLYWPFAKYLDPNSDPTVGPNPPKVATTRPHNRLLEIYSGEEKVHDALQTAVQVTAKGALAKLYLGPITIAGELFDQSVTISTTHS